MASFGTPAFRLYLLRHARAAWAEPGKTDFDRTLDDVMTKSPVTCDSNMAVMGALSQMTQ